jgi:hypothetical protein
MLDAQTAIKLLENKRTVDEQNRLAPAQGFVQGAMAGAQNRIAEDSANKKAVNENKFKLWQDTLKNYDLTDLQGNSLDATTMNTVNNFIAQHDDLPPGIKLSPKQTATYSTDPVTGKVSVGINVPKGAKNVSPKMTTILTPEGDTKSSVSGSVKVLPQIKTKDDQRNMRLEAMKPKRTQEVYDTVNTNNNLRDNISQALDSATRIGTGLGGKLTYTYLKNLKPNDPLLADWQNVKSLLTDAQLMYTAKTKGAISDKEMALFSQAAANDDLKSLPEIKVTLDRMLKKLNSNEDTVVNSYKQSFGENPLEWEDLKSNRNKAIVTTQSQPNGNNNLINKYGLEQ